MNISESIERLKEIQYEIAELKREALDLVIQHTERDSLTQERAYRGWNCQIDIALSTEHQWLGGMTMDTLEETIDALEEESGEHPEGCDCDDCVEMRKDETRPGRV